eukprot:3811283-Rhodomonas_salina.4
MQECGVRGVALEPREQDFVMQSVERLSDLEDVEVSEDEGVVVACQRPRVACFCASSCSRCVRKRERERAHTHTQTRHPDTAPTPHMHTHTKPDPQTLGLARSETHLR